MSCVEVKYFAFTQVNGCNVRLLDKYSEHNYNT